MVEVIPAILSDNPDEARELLKKTEGNVNRVQIDIIDNVFAENKTVDPSVFEESFPTVKLDYHLMVKEPINWVERAIRGHADRIVGHIEMMGNQNEFVNRIHEFGLSAGLAVDLPTPVVEMNSEALSQVEVVILLSVKAGFGGQEFDEKVYKKIKKLSEVRKNDNLDFRICVDGGITKDRIKKLVSLGVDEVSMGRRIFEGDLGGNIESIRKSL